MRFERLAEGGYRSDCGRYSIDRGGWSNLQGWTVSGEYFRKLEDAKAWCVADCEQQKAEQLRIANHVAALLEAETCPPGEDWLQWHNLRHGEDVSRAELKAVHCPRLHEAARCIEDAGYYSVCDFAHDYYETFKQDGERHGWGEDDERR